MEFKSILQNDNNVFLNTDEFASVYRVDIPKITAGEATMPGIIEEITKDMIPDSNYGYLQETTTLFKTASLPLLPRPTSLIRIDGKSYTLLSATNEDGLLSLQLQCNG